MTVVATHTISLWRTRARGAAFATDVEQCPRCHGRLRLIQSITERAVAHAILERLGMPVDPPTAARARDPTDDDLRDDCECDG